MDERKAVLDAVVEEAGGRVPIICGIVEYSTRAAIELGKHAKSAGCCGLMVMPPYGYRPPRRDVFAHFHAVRDAVGLPIMLYNVPGTSGIDFTPEEVQRLAEEGVVQAVKWSTSESGRIRDTKLLCGQKFTVFVGNDLIAFEGLAAGADGWISCLPMIVPACARKLFKLIALDQNLSAAREFYYRLVPLHQAWCLARQAQPRTTSTGRRDPRKQPFCAGFRLARVEGLYRESPLTAPIG